jgi:hypothetical protein
MKYKILLVNGIGPTIMVKPMAVCGKTPKNNKQMLINL